MLRSRAIQKQEREHLAVAQCIQQKLSGPNGSVRDALQLVKVCCDAALDMLFSGGACAWATTDYCPSKQQREAALRFLKLAECALVYPCVVEFYRTSKAALPASKRDPANLPAAFANAWPFVVVAACSAIAFYYSSRYRLALAFSNRAVATLERDVPCRPQELPGIAFTAMHSRRVVEQLALFFANHASILHSLRRDAQALPFSEVACVMARNAYDYSVRVQSDTPLAPPTATALLLSLTMYNVAQISLARSLRSGQSTDNVTRSLLACSREYAAEILGEVHPLVRRITAVIKGTSAKDAGGAGRSSLAGLKEAIPQIASSSLHANTLLSLRSAHARATMLLRRESKRDSVLKARYREDQHAPLLECDASVPTESWMGDVAL